MKEIKLVKSKIIFLISLVLIISHSNTVLADEGNDRVAHDPFAHIQKMREQMKGVFGQTLMDDDFFKGSMFSTRSFPQMDSLTHSDMTVTKFDDDEYKYIELVIDGVDKNSLDISISEGFVRVTARVKRVHKDESDNSQSVSSYVSTFSKSISVPNEVKEQEAKIEMQDDKVIIKFPRIVM